MKANRTNCPNCGAPIPARATHCAYCGTEFDTGLSQYIMVRDRQGMQIVKSQLHVGKEFAFKMEGSDLREMIKHNMARDIAEYIMPMVEIYTTEDPMHDEIIYNGRLRVIDPSIRFN